MWEDQDWTPLIYSNEVVAPVWFGKKGIKSQGMDNDWKNYILDTKWASSVKWPGSGSPRTVRKPQTTPKTPWRYPGNTSGFPRRSSRVPMFPSWTCCLRDPTTNKLKELNGRLRREQQSADRFMDADLWALADEGESIHRADVQQVLDAIGQPRQRGALQPVSWNNHKHLILQNTSKYQQTKQRARNTTHAGSNIRHTHTSLLSKHKGFEKPVLVESFILHLNRCAPDQAVK